ncbi:putative WEB family protein [Helianthus annuus]|uniref:WEB family protein n=2 Tax=Helianthus annuus TaxID=4232 RepID=A0A9K3NWJ0_HELAN|nr:WEB family protein At5g55860 [Helianthus annuus]KAF5815104.1 putative WEB family protein [Helianthus annuus]KAJ0944355.1 putative WEB family protein [Helianthus annuus]
MAAQGRQNKTDSPKVEVGEIDTSSPIRSVKDAVTLFGEGAFSGERITIKKTKARSADRVLKETKFHLAQKEIYKLKEQLKSAETTKTGALTELEQAKRTVDDLTEQLEVTNKAKEAAMKAAMNQAKQFESGVTNINDGLKQDLENTKQQYAAVFTELDAAKHELRRIRHDHETAIKEQHDSKEIMSVQETNEQEQEKAFAEKNVQKLAHKAALKESAKKLLALREQVNPEKSKDLGTERLQREMENARALDLDSLKTVTLGLDGAKDSLQKVFEEESWLKKLLECLKTELENIRKEHKELKEKETETESVVGNRNSKLPDASNETMLTFQQMISENENAKRESEEMKKKAEELKKEAEAMRVALEEAESKLKIALTEADEAKKAEIKVISERTDAAHASSSESSGSKIVISREEFEALSRKVIESEKLEATQKEILDLKAATETAMKRAEAAETCKKAAEGELKRWREREQKKAAEAVALILQETQMQQTQSLPSTPNHKQTSSPRQKMKKVLISNLSGIFHRKKAQVDAGSSPSYLPGEKPV